MSDDFVLFVAAVLRSRQPRRVGQVGRGDDLLRIEHICPMPAKVTIMFGGDGSLTALVQH